MGVDWEAVLASIVPIAAGIAIAFLLTLLSEMWSNRRKRKSLAAVLACEVEAIRAMAAHNIYVDSPNVEDTRKTLDQVGPGRIPSAVAVDDVDFPTEVFRSTLSKVEILGEDVMQKLVELYRWVEYAHHAKRKNLQSHAEFMEVAKRVSSRGGDNPTNLERDIMGNDAMLAVTFATQYLRDLKQILELATQAVADLQRLGKTTVEGKVSVSTGEVLTASTSRK